ncbi:uncharacterized protein DFL_008309 [Arthrobotrys flagrans]|uniref:Uncharacterized protein n=1 Tax=Arthrobotrys flagrans TaxID=97331 RepID=A0A436ZNM8_ARTFL|nr:hypothetical protein DFL_008309 [Arthrobotrys flagrans]
MKFSAVAAAALGFAGSILAAPAPECKTPAVFTVTKRLSPVHTIYKEVIREVTRVPCGPGCKLEIQTVTSTHKHWKGKVTATVTHKQQHTLVPMCELIVSFPDSKDGKGKKDD